jgi:phosphoribosylformimino-5-aminoimidazole carboxamide ribotide isomerase
MMQTVQLPLELYPAIDLKAGACVRLLHGDMDKATTFNRDPADQARRFHTMGFRRLHVVDLDGAFAGESLNASAVAAILKANPAPMQLGGGIRTMAHVERWLEAGVARVILGTAAVRDPDFVRAAARTYPERVAVGIDAREGKVAVAGWAETTDMTALDLARAFEDCGVAALIVTDIGRDGAKTGLNIELTGAMADAVSIPVIASGGLRDVRDLKALRARQGRPVHGAILGRALYEGDLDPAAALAAAG